MDFNIRMTPVAKAVLEAAKASAETMKHSYFGTEHLLLGLIRTDCLPAQVLAAGEVTEGRLLELMERLVDPKQTVGKNGVIRMTPKLRAILEKSREEARKGNQNLVGSEHLLFALLREPDSVAVRLLRTMDVNLPRVMADLARAMGIDGKPYLAELDDNSGKTEGGTPTLDYYSRDLTALAAAGTLDPVVGRKTELTRLIRILSRRTKNNPCLMGEPGVGKTAIVELLAQEMAAGRVPAPLNEYRLLALDLSAMVAGTKYRGEFEERIKKVISEAAADRRVLLFLDEIHTLIGAGGAEGSLDAANILKPSLSRGEIQLIGATTVEEYRKHIEKDAALERRFQPIMVEEPTEEETIEILHGLCQCYEEHHGVKIGDDAIDAAARLSARYINDRFLPDKALDLLDEAASKVRMSGGKSSRSLQKLEEEYDELEQAKALAVRTGDFAGAAGIRKKQQKIKERQQKLQDEGNPFSIPLVTEDEIAQVVSDWTRIPAARLAEGEAARLRRLESLLHQRVVGQEEAVSAVARAVRRSRVGLKDPNRPIGSFLFLGPTGVGKTELAKSLAEAMFGKEEAMIRVDMSEYMEKHSVSKLIGSPPGYVGYEEGGQLSEKVRRNPYSVILFDEIEKAHPDVFQVLLQVLDDGHITDAQGRRVNFKNTILIMTSNAGAERIMSPKKLGFSAGSDSKADYLAMKTGVMEEVRRLFKPEFLNRIDETIVFHSLEKEHLEEILKLMLKTTGKRIYGSLGITLRVTHAAREYLLTKGYDAKYGARPLRRALQTSVEDALAEEILEGHIHAGDTVTVACEKNELKFRVKEPTEITKEEES